jgi:prevent-host-death family protein
MREKSKGRPAELNLTEARARFSELIVRVEFGKEVIVICKHGHPVAELRPVGEHEAIRFLRR